MIRDNKEEVEDARILSKRNEAILQEIVTRESFNNFIERVDQERHSQVKINLDNAKEIAQLKGRLDTLEKFVHDRKGGG